MVRRYCGGTVWGEETRHAVSGRSGWGLGREEGGGSRRGNEQGSPQPGGEGKGRGRTSQEVRTANRAPKPSTTAYPTPSDRRGLVPKKVGCILQVPEAVLKYSVGAQDRNQARQKKEVRGQENEALA